MTRVLNFTGGATILSVARRFWRHDRDHPDVAEVGPVMREILEQVAAEKERDDAPICR